MSSFDYEFEFFNKTFDQTIYDQCQIIDPARQAIVEAIVDQVIVILNNLIGVNKFSTFVDSDGLKYKITVHGS